MKILILTHRNDDHARVVADALEKEGLSLSNGCVKSFYLIRKAVYILVQLGRFPSLNDRIGLWTHNLEIERQSNRLNPACKTCILVSFRWARVWSSITF